MTRSTGPAPPAAELPVRSPIKKKVKKSDAGGGGAPVAVLTFSMLLQRYMDEHDTKAHKWNKFSTWLVPQPLARSITMPNGSRAEIESVQFDESVKFPVGARMSAQVSLLFEKDAGLDDEDNTVSARSRIYSGPRVTSPRVDWS